MRLRTRIVLLSVLVGAIHFIDCTCAAVVPAVPIPPGDYIAPASREAEAVMKQFRLPPGFRVDLFAAEPMLANPVAFDIDHRGRAYVVETFRHSAVGPAYRFYEGTFDVRSHMDWLEDDLAARSVSDRVAMYRKHLAPQDFSKLNRLSERVRFLEDTNHDGRADRATIFAEGFNQPEDGIAAGVLARGTNVYFTCIPNLWRLSDANGDGKADTRDVLSTGYGVHIAFIGHDLHGLTMGPDGRLYFSIGDRGINVTNKEGQVLSYPDEGVVLRCEPDGANLEVFHRGLRNPQELVFNEYGDLFTADNNSDGGDRARWVHLIEGGDSGWRIGYQHLTKPPRRGPWNGEQLWRPHFEGQPAWIVPPIANLGYGPSGLAYHPGTGSSDRYRGHFFLCDFRGGASSGIHTFTLKPKGASFELATYDQFVWECLPTDVAFGPDGALYFSDWVEGWNKTGKGRIYRVFDLATINSKEVLETKKLLAEGMAKRREKELVELLGHRDKRVRMEAQFELAAKGTNAFAALRDVAFKSKNQLTRLHAIWGIGQVVRTLPTTQFVDEMEELLELLHDDDAEVRGHAARLLGEARLTNAQFSLTHLIEDPAPRVRVQAILAYRNLYTAFGTPSHPEIGHRFREPLGERLRQLLERLTKRSMGLPARAIRHPVAALTNVLNQSTSRDPYLIHSAAAFLQEIGEVHSFLTGWSLWTKFPELATNVSATVRLPGLIAMRRLSDPLVANYLTDTDTNLILEAARAINDVPIDGALPSLAALLTQPEVLQKFTALDAAASRTASVPHSQLAISNQQSPVSNDTNGRSTIDRHRKPTSGVEAAISSVATETGSWTFTEQVFYRVLNANFRLGQPEHAAALARFAANSAAPASLRAEALDALADWARPSPLDRVMGLHRPLAPRDPKPAAEALQPTVAEILRTAPEPVRLAALKTIENLQAMAAEKTVFQLITSSPSQLATSDQQSPVSNQAAPSNPARLVTSAATDQVPAAALRTLAALKSPRLPEALQLALKSENAALRREALRLQVENNPSVALAQIATTLEAGSIRDQQAALATLVAVRDPAADILLERWLDKLLANQVPPEIEIDLLDAASQRSAPSVLSRIRQFEARRAKSNLGAFREALYGGDATAGRRLFFEREEIGCSKCHTINGAGGQAGPVLTGIGSRKDREYLVESITHPNAQITEGWENLLVTTEDGTTYAGILKSENASAVEINSPEDGLVQIAKSKIKTRTRTLSAMPEEFRQILPKKDLRDLVEFLATSK